MIKVFFEPFDAKPHHISVLSELISRQEQHRHISTS